MLSFVLPTHLGAAQISSFGVAVRAPRNTSDGAAVIITFNVSASQRRQHSVDGSCHGVDRHVMMIINSNVSAEWPLLCGEDLAVRILVDRPVVEVFGNGGRGSFVFADNDFDLSKQSVHVFNSDDQAVVVNNVSVYGMACGWQPDVPTSLVDPPSRSAE